MPSSFRISWVVVVSFLTATANLVAQDADAGSRASELFRNRQYQDTIRVLLPEVKDRPEAGCVKQYLLLGESYYLLHQYDPARAAFVKVVQYGEGRDKQTAEYRLACAWYRLGDPVKALERIDDFLGKYPGDPVVGKLLAYKMLILGARGKAAEKEVEALHQKIQQNVQKYDPATGMEADDILCDFYRQTRQEEKAQALYARVVNNFRQVAAEFEQERRPVPDALKRSCDNAALQLGLLAMEHRNSGEAIKWFENVRFDPDTRQKARLYMAKLAYERQDYNGTINYLTADAYLDTVPDGAVKWDMCLLLGLAYQRSAPAGADPIEGALRRVPAQARGFPQAQLALANLYRDKKMPEYALKAFQNALASPDYAATSLLNIGCLQIELAARTGMDASQSRALYQQAGETLDTLFAKFPLSVEARQAREQIPLLAGKGVVVTADAGEAGLAAWERTAREKPGSVEAAQALMSLARYHSKKLVDAKTGKLVRAPDHFAVAAACDHLLDDKVYTGQGWNAADWRAFRCEMLFTRAQSELAGIAPAPPKPGEPETRFAPTPQADRAAAWLLEASKLVDAKQLDLVRSIEIALVEALFKSSRREDKEQAEKRFVELENNYASDPRLQRLSLDLADWYAEQKRPADAGRMLAGVAIRGKDLPPEELLKILYTAGAMYSQAGQDAAQKSAEPGYWIRIGPKAAVALAGDGQLPTYSPLQQAINMKWPQGGRNLTAGEALLALSQAARIPFTWAAVRIDGSVATYLERRRVTLADGATTPAEALRQLLEPQHRVEFAIGLTDGVQTWQPPMEKDDPDIEPVRTLEIWDTRRPDLYYRPAGAPFGAFRDVYGGRPALLFSILQRVEGATRMRVVWAEGVDRQEKLATEFRELPGLGPEAGVNCLQALNAALDSLGLEWRIVPRDAAAEYYEAAKEQFNRLRQIDPKSKFGERALLRVALNYHALRDYPKMKAILKEYLKVFDNADNENRQMAAFWIGWVFEKENNFREAGNYYGRAAEERLIVCAPGTDRKPPARAQVQQQLSYDSQAALLETASGEFTNQSLRAVLDFVALNARIEVRTDPGLASIDAPVNRPAFMNAPIFDVLCDALEPLGLTFRVENVNPEYAEKAIFRMVAVNRKDNAMPQALEAAQTLLRRFPETPRRREVYGMLVDIYKGLKDYRKVIETLAQLREITRDADERRKLDNEVAWIYFDEADYERALKLFDACLSGAKDPQERLDMREGHARAAFRAGRYKDSLADYETLRQEDRRPLRQYIDNLMVFLIQLETGKADECDIPRDAEKLLVSYEQLTEPLRARLAPEEIAKATWTYYAFARHDLKKGYIDQAITKLNACANSTDDNLAAEALFELGSIYMARKKYGEARDALEELLFRGKGTDALVRGTYALGACYQELGRNEKAREKFQQLLDRYPLSPLVAEVKKNALFVARDKPAAPP